MAFHQPVNILSPWGVVTDDKYVGIDENGDFLAEMIVVDRIQFGDGSTMSSAGSGLPSVIDIGTF